MIKNRLVHDFISIALQSGGWMELDRLYLENQVISLVGPVNEEEEIEEETQVKSSKELVHELLLIAEKNELIDLKDSKKKEELNAKLMSFLTPPPSVVNALFSQHYDTSEKEATDYFYLMNLTNGYVNEENGQYKKSIINDHSFIIQSKKCQRTNEFTVCPYCFESEGSGKEENMNKRLIRMNLKGESWGFYYQSNPLVREHSIFTPESHQPLVMNRQLQDTMLQLVDVYPHYFVSLDPDVIKLSPHGFLYGGDNQIPLALADNDFMFDIPGFVTVEASLVDWPMSIIRLKTTSKKNLINALEYVTLKWQQYSYPSLDIIAKDAVGKDLHSVLPVFRKEEDAYIVEMILKDSSSEFDRSKEYASIVHEDAYPVDQLGIINLRQNIEIDETTLAVITENMAKQSIFRRPQDGQKAFLRFIDTL